MCHVIVWAFVLVRLHAATSSQPLLKSRLSKSLSPPLSFYIIQQPAHQSDCNTLTNVQAYINETPQLSSMALDSRFLNFYCFPSLSINNSPKLLASIPLSSPIRSLNRRASGKVVARKHNSSESEPADFDIVSTTGIYCHTH